MSRLMQKYLPKSTIAKKHLEGTVLYHVSSESKNF